MHPGDEVGPGEDEVLVAPFQLLAPEVGCGQVLGLDPGPEGAIQDEHSRFERGEEVGHQG